MELKIYINNFNGVYNNSLCTINNFVAKSIKV